VAKPLETGVEVEVLEGVGVKVPEAVEVGLGVAVKVLVGVDVAVAIKMLAPVVGKPLKLTPWPLVPTTVHRLNEYVVVEAVFEKLAFTCKVTFPKAGMTTLIPLKVACVDPPIKLAPPKLEGPFIRVIPLMLLEEAELVSCIVKLVTVTGKGPGLFKVT
jgi:hypothetical protein